MYGSNMNRRNLDHSVNVTKETIDKTEHSISKNNDISSMVNDRRL